MRTLIANVEQRKQRGNGCFLVNTEESIELAYELLERVEWGEVFLYSEDESVVEKLKKKIENVCVRKQISYEVIRGLALLNDKLKETGLLEYLFFDENTNQELIEKLVVEMKPQAIYGSTYKNKEFLYHIWEVARAFSEHVFMQSKRLRVADVLEWSKGEEDILLSVVFPVYNVAQYLEQCIKSVTAWKAPYVEFLFVNDGSKDESADIIARYQKEDSRIKLIHKENGGCASARKMGLELAKGKYVGFVDPDDFVDETMFQKLLIGAYVGGFDFAYCGYNFYYNQSGKSEKVDDALGKPYNIGTYNKEEIDRLICWLRVAIWRGIYKKSVLEKNQISFHEDLRRFDDLPFKIEVLTKIKSAVAIPEHLYYYRLERPGQDVACNDERLKVHFDIFKHLDDFVLPQKDQRRIDYLQVVRVQTHFYALEKIQEQYMLDYAKLAREDILKNASAKRTEGLVRDYASKKYAKAFHYLVKGKYQKWDSWGRLH